MLTISMVSLKSLGDPPYKFSMFHRDFGDLWGFGTPRILPLLPGPPGPHPLPSPLVPKVASNLVSMGGAHWP